MTELCKAKLNTKTPKALKVLQGLHNYQHSQRLLIYYQYGIRSQKTILFMVMGTFFEIYNSMMVVYVRTPQLPANIPHIPTIIKGHEGSITGPLGAPSTIMLWGSLTLRVQRTQ